MFRVMAVGIGLAGALLLCEAALRLAGYGGLYFNPLHSFHEPDARVGYRGKPGFSGRFRQPEFDVVIAHDDLGFRLQEHQAADPQASRERVLVFGDSFTWGWGVAQGRVFTDRMSRAMPGVWVGNFGLNGTGTAQQFALFGQLREEGTAPLGPGDTLLLMFFANDFHDSLEGRGGATLRDGSIQPIEAPPGALAGFGQRLKGFLKIRSKLFNFLAFSYDRAKAARHPGRQGARVTEAGQLSPADPAVAIARHFLGAFQRAASEGGARFVAAYIPGQAELGEALTLDIDRLEAERAHRRAFFRLADELGIPTLDLLRAFVEGREAAPKLRFTFPNDEHWNETGHATAAAALADFLREAPPTAR